MTAAPSITVPDNWPKEWLFETGTSKVVGAEGPLITKLRDNAPRIVGAMKVGMDATVATSGNPFLMGYAFFAIIGRFISIIYGTKKHQEKLAEEKAQGEHHILGHGWIDNSRKVLRPREYPVESSAGFSVVAETVGSGYGVQQFVSGATGFTPLLLGLLAIYSYGNIVFKKEKGKNEPEKSDPLLVAAAHGQMSPFAYRLHDIVNHDPALAPMFFAKSDSKIAGMTGRLRAAMKDNPVLVSSMINVVICIGMVTGGIIEGLTFAYIMGGVIGGLANLTQGLLVRKNEFNIEGAEMKETGRQNTAFQERVVKDRSRGEPGVQPA